MISAESGAIVPFTREQLLLLALSSLVRKAENRPLRLRCRTPRHSLDDKAPRRFSDRRGAFFTRCSVNFTREPCNLWLLIVRLRRRFKLLASCNSALRLRQFHSQRQRFVIESFRSATCVLDQHYEVVLVLAKSRDAATLIHDHKQQHFTIRRSHLAH